MDILTFGLFFIAKSIQSCNPKTAFSVISSIANAFNMENAIHKNIKTVEEKLNFYEEKLQLYKKKELLEDLINKIDDKEIKEKLESLY